MTEYEALEEFINEEMTNSINSRRTANHVLPDILNYFTSNVPAYNTELEIENFKLKEQIKILMEFTAELGQKALDLVNDIEKSKFTYDINARGK